jgi:predicted RecA/RadA family phage recombinase
MEAVMAKNLFKEGDNITLPSTGAVVAGRIYVLGDLIGVALNGATAAGIPIVYSLKRDVYNFDKATGEAWTVGAKLYWDSANARLTTTSAGNTLVANAYAAAIAGATTGQALIRSHLA